MSLTDFLAGATLYASAPLDNKVLLLKDSWETINIPQPRGVATEPSGRWSVVTQSAVLTYEGDQVVRTLHAGIDRGHEAVIASDGFHVADPQRSSVTHVAVAGTTETSYRISGVDDSDDNRTHVNGIAVDDSGTPRLVSALGLSNIAGGWRAEAAASRGAIVDVVAQQVVYSGLLFPHSPRMHDGATWFLNSGLSQVRRGDDVFATLHGFARGLAFFNDHVFVGVSQARPSSIDAIQSDPLAEPGIVVLDSTGAQVAFEPLDVREIFDIQIGS